MGDRGVVVVRQWNDNDVVLYTHYGASELEETLKSALSKRVRWGDGPYLSRIIFEEMVAGAYSKETGFGIQAEIPGDVWRVLRVHIAQQTVELVDHKKRVYQKSFEDFINSGL